MKFLAYYMNGTLQVDRPNEILISWETKSAMIISSLKSKGIPVYFPETIPGDEKYRDAWEISPDGKHVKVNSEKAISIARKRAEAALISFRKKKSMRDEYEVDIKNAFKTIKKCSELRILEWITRALRQGRIKNG